MFPNTVTIYRHEIKDNRDVYFRQVVKGFYIWGSMGLVGKGKGAENDDKIKIMSSPERAADYGKTWNVKKGDLIIKGTGKEISALKELAESFTVMSVEENICGSSVDNVLIVCK